MSEVRSNVGLVLRPLHIYIVDASWHKSKLYVHVCLTDDFCTKVKEFLFTSPFLARAVYVFFVSFVNIIINNHDLKDRYTINDSCRD